MGTRTPFLSSPGPSPSPCPNRPPSRIKVPQIKKKEGFGPWADTKITWATTPLIKECSGKKVQKIKVAQNDPLDSTSQKIGQVDSEIKDVG